MENVKSSLIFKDYVVEEVFFKMNLNFKEEPVELNIDIQKDVNLKDNQMDVKLTVELFKDIENESNYPFAMKVVVIGHFMIENNVENINFEPNAIAILYPYVRAIISNYTANANVNPVILPAINVVKFLEK